MVKILAVSDIEDRALYDHFDEDRWRSAAIDLIVSCGDLKASYLSYLVSRFDVPLFYVPGNHDGDYQHAPPEGADTIDRQLVHFKGLRILGLGGSLWYNGGPEQLSDGAMQRRILALRPRIWLAGGIDLVVTHAPPQYCPLAHTVCKQPAGRYRPCITPEKSARTICLDAPDRAHQGFRCFRGLIDMYHPPYFLHGHTHLSYGQSKRMCELGQTKCVDTYGYFLFQLDPLHN